MVSLSQRMRKLQTKLLAIRLGPGALVLPQNVKRIHMRFAAKINGGHMGPRQFWRHELIRLKYHNPAVPMTIDRIKTSPPSPETEAVMSIHFTSPQPQHMTSDSATASPAPISSTTTSIPTSASDEHDPTDRVETIEMKHRTNSEILDKLIKVTGAYPVEPTPQDREEVRMLEEQRVRSQRDAKLSAEVRARARREREILEQARGDLAGQQAVA